MLDQVEEIDIAVAAYHDGGRWRVDDISDHFLEDIDTLASGLRRFPGDGGALGLISVEEDFFLLVRVTEGTVRVLLSDVTAAQEWELARTAVEDLHLPVPDDEDQVVPVGELGILADVGISASAMAEILDDDLDPEEALSEVADLAGFGDLFDDAAGLAPA